SGLRGGFAVTPALDEGVEACDQSPDVHRERPVAFDQRILAVNQGALAFEQSTLAFEDRMESLLALKMLLADAEVELGESLFLEPVPFAEKANHLLDGLAARQARESSDERRFQVAEAGAHFPLEVGEAGRQVVVQSLQGDARSTFAHRFVIHRITAHRL